MKGGCSDASFPGRPAWPLLNSRAGDLLKPDLDSPQQPRNQDHHPAKN